MVSMASSNEKKIAVSNQRLSVPIRGQVQGVGFRPQIYRIAKSLNLTGWVANNAEGLILEVQGKRVIDFLPSLTRQLPALAIVDTIASEIIPAKPCEEGFAIQGSQPGKVTTNVAADVAICQPCLYELFDPQSRFYHYPFLNCTNCGPRYSIICQLPYDRQQTTMADFPMCADCQHDYDDPQNRRYHAQPTACPQCGPRYSNGYSHTVAEIANAIKEGKIVALKSMGGYQLICDAHNENALAKLRMGKQRPEKPFAIMLANIASVKQLVACNPEEAQLLTSWQRPIVLLKKRAEHLPQAIAPNLSHLGVMLPYTPIHYLLFHAVANFPKGHLWLTEYQSTVLVVTSANPSGLPLIVDDQQANQELSTIADMVVGV